MKLFANLLIFLGFIFYGLAGYYIWLRYDSSHLAFTNYQEVVPEKAVKKQQDSIKKSPTQVIIHDVGINLPLIPTSLHDRQWETTDKGASYLTSSPVPGETGNSIIYGHNWPVLFGNLTKTHPGQHVEIVYNDDSRATFVIEYTALVPPTDSSILTASTDKRITLYTCAGWFDDKRFVAVALKK